MAQESPLKIAFGVIAMVASLGYAATVWLDIDVSEKLSMGLSSLWSDSTSDTSQQKAGFELEIPSTPGKKASKIGKNATPPADEPLNLNIGAGLDELNEDLMEDRIWEEGIAYNRAEGERSGRAVLEALAEIDSWGPVEGGYNSTKLMIYLRHPKIWVRLSAFAFAVKAQALNETQLMKIARIIKLKGRSNPTQVARFLLRYERRDPDLYASLVKQLLDSEGPPPKLQPAPPTLPVDEEDFESES